MKTNKIQIRNAFVRAADTAINEENRTVQFVISSEAVDSFKTVFKRSGWLLEDYIKNPIVCYNHFAHGADPDTIIGTSRVFFEGDLLIGEVTFEDAATNPLAEKVFRKILNGTLRMASINARIFTARLGIEENGEDPNVMYFTKQSLQEWSVVSIASNTDASKRNNTNLVALRSKVENETTADPGVDPGNKETSNASFDWFDAQLMLNQKS